MDEFKTFPKPVKKETPQKWGVYRKYSKQKKFNKKYILENKVDKTNVNESETAILYAFNKEKTKYAYLFRRYYPKIAKISNELYEAVKERSGGKCEICGSRAEEIHHLVGRRRTAHLENLRYLCKNCHKPPNGIHANMDLYWQEMNKYQEWCKSKGFSKEETQFLLGRKDNSLVSDWITGERLI